MTTRDLLIGSASGAVISECGKFRYLLSRQWDSRPLLLFVMLNPSTADAHVDDATIRRCVTFAAAHDFGGIEVVNLFAFRATQRRDLALVGWPAGGPEADRHIAAAAVRAGAICAAWGVVGDRGPANDRVQQVAPILRASGKPLQCLRVTRSGYPQHPLYLPSICRLQDFAAAVDAALGAALCPR